MRKAALLFLLAMGFLPFIVFGQAGEFPAGTSDAEIKAGFLIKFKRYTTWPQEKLPENSPITIGVAGASEIAQELERKAAARGAYKRQIRIKRLQPGDTPSDIHMLFIGNDRMAEFNDWLGRARGQPVLIVTDSGNGMPQGSMINFVRDNDRVRFDVSPTAATASGLELSTELLTVARQVQGNKP